MRLPRLGKAAALGHGLVLWLGLAAGMCAGQSDTGGGVGGQVTGPDGQGVAGAAVRLEDVTGNHTDGVSDLHGNFRFGSVTPGEYTLRVRAQGLSSWEGDHLTVGLGTAAELRVRLTNSWTHRTVLVDATLVSAHAGEPGAGGDAGNLANELPNNSLHWSSMAALLSGSGTGEDGAPSFRGLSPLMNSIAVDGTDNTLAFRSRERGTGADGAGSGFATAQSSVGVFQVSGISPEYRRAAGGSVTTLTKSGGNRMHGQGVFYDRGAIGQTFNAFSKTMVEEPAGTTETGTGQPLLYLNGQPITYVETPYRAPDRRQQWEVSAGGPVRRDRVYWFFSWAQHERNDPAVARANEPEVFFAPPSATSLSTLEARIASSTNPLLDGCPAAGSAGSTARAECAWTTVLGQINGMLGTVPRSTRQTILFPKLSWRINPRNQMVVQLNSMRRTGLHAALGGATETYAAGSFGNSSTSDDAAVARWEWFATPRWMSSARYQYSRDVLSQTPATASTFEAQFANNGWGLAPEVSIDRSQGFSFGTLANVNKREYPLETRQQFADAGTRIHGRQALRFGYDYNYVTETLDGLAGENGAYSYASLTDFLSDMLAPNSCDGTTTGNGPYPCYARFRQTLGGTNWSFETADYAAYLANEWRVGQRLTLTLGARYEYEQVPDTNTTLINPTIPETAHLPHNRDGAGPRAGFAWDVFGKGHTVVRGGLGIFYARVPNATVFSALTSTGMARSPRTYTYRPLDASAPAFPYVFASDETPHVNPIAPNHNSTAPEAVYFDPQFRHPQINQMELSLQQELGARTVLTLTAMATDGHDLTQFIDTNIDLKSTATMFYSVTAPGNTGNIGPLGKATSGVSGYTNRVYQPQRFYYQRLNPAYGAITDMLSETNSQYRGATVRLVRRMSRPLTVNAAYTWAHAIDDNQNEATFAERNDVYDPADLSLEHGTSNYDVRQRVAGGIVLREPWRPHGPAGMMLGGYSLAGSGAWRTGLPWSMRTIGAVPTPSCSYANWLNAGGATGDGANCLLAVTQPDETFTDNTAGMVVPIASLGPSLNGSGGEDLIPPTGRNTFRYPASVNLDLRFTKRIRISDRCSFEIMGEAYNALNHRNVTNIQTIGYRVANDTIHPNMATLTWQSGEKPGTKTVLVNGASQTQYVFDPTAAFGNVTNANSGAVSRERQVQVGFRLNF
ncbi:MAG TPA: carboxypeptidase regulatory-like domain-containing protein [Acidobacteriaceae bacterium]